MKIVMNWLDPIEELYNMYLEEEKTPRIVEVMDLNLDFDLDIEDVMNRLGQAFWHQEMVAVINGWLWEYAVTPLGRCKG